MVEKQTLDGSLPFKETAPLLPSAVGVGYLKQPLRYLTGDDIRTMASKTMSYGVGPSFTTTTDRGEKLDWGGNNLHFVGVPRVSMHGSSKNTWGKCSFFFPETEMH
jgi:hypothetical protein